MPDSNDDDFFEVVEDTSTESDRCASGGDLWPESMLDRVSGFPICPNCKAKGAAQ